MDEIHCKYCGSSRVIKRGFQFTDEEKLQRYQCLDENHPENVSRYFTVNENGETLSEESEYTVGRDFINIVLSSPRILTEEDLITQFQVDTTKWEIESFQVKTSEGYRKDKQVDWHVQGGVVEEGHSVDSGKMLVVPLFHIRAKFRRKVEEIRANLVIQDLLEDVKRGIKPIKPIFYNPNKRGTEYLYEIDMPDIHFGRLTWADESGEDYDIKIAHDAVHTALDKLLNLGMDYKVSKILLPIGNDFFNVNSKLNTTVHGTPQQEDTRWSKTFTKGRRLIAEVIDKCLSVAPVDVLILTGNHDEEKTFYLGEVLDAQYSKHPNVTVDNSPKTRKYYLHGVNLIGFAHGYDEKIYQLPSLMALEAPEMWAKSKYREFHTGDKHHKFDSNENGVTVRILRALAARDAWTVNNGYVGALRAAESFLWHPTEGLIAQFTATPYN